MSTTMFLQTRLHASRLHGRGPRASIHITCPACGLAYFVDPLTGLGEAAHPAAAALQLQEQCPRHDRLLLIESHAAEPATWLEALPRFPVPASQPERSSAWRVTLTGLVERPAQLSLAELQALPSRELVADFACEEGWGVPRLHWAGVPLSAVLEQVGVTSAAEYIAIGAGEFVTTLPLSGLAAMDPLLAYSLNGSPLPAEHGGPLRLVAADTRCYQSVKWIDHIALHSEQPLETAALFARERIARGR